MSGLFATLIAAATGAPGTVPAVQPRPVTRFEDAPFEAIDQGPAPTVDAPANPAMPAAHAAPPVAAAINRPVASGSATPTLLPPGTGPVAGRDFRIDPAIRATPAEQAATHRAPRVSPLEAARHDDLTDRVIPAANMLPSPVTAGSDSLHQGPTPIPPKAAPSQLLPAAAVAAEIPPAAQGEPPHDAFSAEVQPLLRIGRIEVRPPPERKAAPARTIGTGATTRVALPRAAVRQSLDDYRAGRKR